ncbi:SirB2 family protein [Agitococcus lubricus]|uniref:Putative membrane protein SirB2 n=1 Tax=Agitococcus lubricus TaxID=1077255 RepID=A0A2T5IWM7_9GAMM|nr:SirB2 family protein [Agitococcus lubricus]PTQ88361.1 putative membrane protein SirB2 [Agitococcus lubricus]
MNTYMLVKHLHLLAVVLSGLFFMVRSVWALQQSPQLQAKWVRISPHIIDTVLLFSAMTLLVLSNQFPVWVHVKLTLLVVYIGLGLVALKKAKTQGQRLVFIVLAMAVYGFIISVAVTKSPLGLLS